MKAGELQRLSQQLVHLEVEAIHLHILNSVTLSKTKTFVINQVCLKQIESHKFFLLSPLY